MNVMEYIVAEQQRQGLSNSELAGRLPFSRQRFEEIIRQGDCWFRIVRVILNALGRDIGICNQDGAAPNFDVKKRLDEMDGLHISYTKIKAVIEMSGLALYVTDAGASDGAPVEKENFI